MSDSDRQTERFRAAVVELDERHNSIPLEALLPELLSDEMIAPYARIWACVMYHFEWVETDRAEEIVLPCLDSPQPSVRAAGFQLLGGVRWQGTASNEVLDLLGESVKTEPRWVNNRTLLADALDQRGEPGRAVSLLDVARQCFLDSPPATAWEEAWETTITGRFSSRAHFERVAAAIGARAKDGHG